MKNKESIFRALLLVITFVIVFVVVLFNQNYFGLGSDHAKEIEEPIGDTVTTITDYKIYDFKDVPFRFLLVDVKLSSSKPINFGLSRFQTDDGLSLNNIDEYRSEISRKGYDLSLQGVATQLVSNENELNAKILVPIKNNYRQTMRLFISGVSEDILYFDLIRGPKGSAEDLGKTEIVTDPLVETPDEDVVVDNPDESDDTPPEEDLISNTIQFSTGQFINKDLILYKGLDEYHRVDFANKIRILLVNVTFDFDHEVSIVAARLNFIESGDLFFALGPEYVNENGNNILGKKVTQETGSLLFQIDDRLFDALNQPYDVEVRFEGDSHWQAISMNHQ